MKTIKKGSKGDEVKVLQLVVGVVDDGKFGSKTKTALKKWQKKYGLDADGVAGPKTWSKMADIAPTIKVGSSGTWVKVLEVLLETMTDDGAYNAIEKQAVKAYQTSKKLDADGIVGHKTWAMLFGVTTVVNTAGGTNTKKPVDYKQYDSKWGRVVYTKNNTYNRSQTIRNSGCGPTSAADIVATWWDKSITPKELCALAVKHGYRTNNDGTAWGFFKFIANRFGANKFVQTSSFATMQGCLEDGGYVVVSFKKSKWTNGG